MEALAVRSAPAAAAHVTTSITGITAPWDEALRCNALARRASPLAGQGRVADRLWNGNQSRSRRRAARGTTSARPSRAKPNSGAVIVGVSIRVGNALVSYSNEYPPPLVAVTAICQQR